MKRISIKTSSAAVASLYLTILAASIGGWVVNIIKLVGMLGEPSFTPMFVARIVGIPFGPLGAVLGYI